MNTIGKNISILNRQFTAFVKRELERTEYTAAEFVYLMSLYKRDGISQDELAKEHCIDKSAIARTIQGMEDKGLVVRQTDAGDKRAKQVFLTQKARDLQKPFEEIQLKWIAAMHMDLNTDDIRVFEAVLARMAAKARDLNDFHGEFSGQSAGIAQLDRLIGSAAAQQAPGTELSAGSRRQRKACPAGHVSRSRSVNGKRNGNGSVRKNSIPAGSCGRETTEVS